MSWFSFGDTGSAGGAQLRGRTSGASILNPPPARVIPAGTVITPGGAVPRDLNNPQANATTTGPQPPDASLAASNAAAAAQAAQDRAKKKATAASATTVLTGTPGASTPSAGLMPRTLIGR